MIKAWCDAKWWNYEIALIMGMIYIELIYIALFVWPLWFLVILWAAMFYGEIAFQCSIRRKIEYMITSHGHTHELV